MLQVFWQHLCLAAANLKTRIPRYYEFLSHLHLDEHDYYWIFDVIRCLRLLLILHQVYGHYLDVPNVEPVHQFKKYLLAYPTTIYFAPFIHWSLMAATTILLRELFMFLTR